MGRTPAGMPQAASGHGCAESSDAAHAKARRQATSPLHVCHTIMPILTYSFHYVDKSFIFPVSGVSVQRPGCLRLFTTTSRTVEWAGPLRLHHAAMRRHAHAPTGTTSWRNERRPAGRGVSIFTRAAVRPRDSPRSCCDATGTARENRSRWRCLSTWTSQAGCSGLSWRNRDRSCTRRS